MDRLEIFQDRLTNGLKTIFLRIRHTPATSPVVEDAVPKIVPLPSPIDEDPFVKQTAAALVEIFHSPDAEVVVDPESGLHRLPNSKEVNPQK